MFAFLNNLPQFPDKCIKEAINAKYDQVYRPDLLRAFSSFNNTTFVKDLQRRFGKCGGMYLKNLPMTYYDWHIDMNRQCSINWLLLNEGGSALYREHIPSTDGKSITYKISKVEYALYKPTMLDVTKEHCVINDTGEQRIIFSLSFDAPFADVYKHVSALHLTDYESR